MEETIYFYYTNDLHSHFEHWPHVAAYMKDKQDTRKLAGEAYYLADIGDHMDRVHPISEATMGKANVELLNKLEYDFATIGNNEGITLSHDDFYHLYDDARFAVICSNLTCTVAPNPPWLLSSKVVETSSGVKIGIVGLTARFNPYYHKLGWDVKDLFETLDRELMGLRDETDIIVLLSHTGINSDEDIAKRYPEIDLIIGGHTHHLLATGELVNDVLLTAAGKFCAHVGEVAIYWDHKTKKVRHKVARTTDVRTYPKHLPTENRLIELKEAADSILEKKIITTDLSIKAHWFRDSAIMLRLTKELRAFGKADIAMLNAGLLLDGFDAGDITYKDVHRICPHPINPCVVSLTGAEVMEVVRIGLKREFIELKLQGFGFRGEVIGKMIYDGLEVISKQNDLGEEQLQAVLFGGEELDLHGSYTFVTADAFIFGQLIPPIADAEEKQLLLPEFIRDILVGALLKYQN